MGKNEAPELWPSFTSLADGRTIEATSLIADTTPISVRSDKNDTLHPGDRVTVTVSAWDPHGRRMKVDAKVHRHEDLGTTEIDSDGEATFFWDVHEGHIQDEISLFFTVTALDADHHRRHNDTDQDLFARYRVRPQG